MKKIASLLTLLLLVVTVSACVPALMPTSPTFVLSPSSTPTITFTPTASSIPTLTITPSPLPSSTATFGFKRISPKELIPNLVFEIPISFEIPQDYVLFEFPDSRGNYFWMPQKQGEVFPLGDIKTVDSSYFEASLAPNVTYDSKTDRFINLPNDMNEKDLISSYESYGAKINRIERKNIGEFPMLIQELELFYETTPGVMKSRLLNRIYIATLVDTNVIWIGYVFSLPTNLQKESTIWKRFESSFERNP